MGGLTLYGQVADRQDRSGQLMWDWFSMDNWTPLSQTGLHPTVDVEDLGDAEADVLTVSEFVSFVRDGTPTDTSHWAPGTPSRRRSRRRSRWRSGSQPREVPALPEGLVAYFLGNQAVGAG